MLRIVRTVALVLTFTSGAVSVALFQSTGCSSSSGGACNALVACCMSNNQDDQSSCVETAMSGELSDAQCGMELEMYEQNGTCPVDGGPFSRDATPDTKK
jgi:hypothetical protein